DSSRFECRPTLLKHENSGNCMFTSKIPKGQVLMCPSAHAEGKLLFPAEEMDLAFDRLAEKDMLVFRYVDPNGNYAGYPWNPNGSPHNIAGVCNPQGNVFGMMPHPERVMDRQTHPDWTRSFPTDIGDGRVIFESVLDEITKRF
ncbi:MAG: phosphoribosylformylglycinamidine synthase subunit PurQ, partial [Thermoplasmata archaeon]|nr:phosphoribosylformylglycinamidine synthase subunit PurQ [Thermoplasmata archaeon]